MRNTIFTTVIVVLFGVYAVPSVIAQSTYIQIELRSGVDGTPFALSESSSGYAVCTELSGKGIFSKVLLHNDSTTLMEVQPGSYRCEANIEGFGSTKSTVIVKESTTTAVQVIVLDRNGTVTVRLIDALTGEKIEGLDTEFSLWTKISLAGLAPIDDKSQIKTSRGETTLPTVGGLEYKASIYIQEPDKGTPVLSDGRQYLIPSELVSFQAVSGQNIFVDFLLYPTTSSLKVSLVNQEGEPIGPGLITAVTRSQLALESEVTDQELYSDPALSSNFRSVSETRAFEHFVSDRIEASGSTNIPLISGHTYLVKVSSPVGYIDAAEKRVLLTPGETRELIFSAITPENSVPIKVHYPKSVAKEGIQRTWCTASGPQGERSSTEESDSDQVIIDLPSPSNEPWIIFCRGRVSSEGKVLLFSGSSTYTDVEDIQVSLTDEVAYHRKETYEFDAEQEATIITVDKETTLEFPAGSLAETGVIELVVETAQDYAVTPSEMPLKLFDFKLFLNDEPVTETKKPVLISFKVDQEELALVGATTDRIFPARWDQELQAWVRERNYHFDPETLTFTVQVSHFSIWGILVDTALKLKREAPSLLKKVKTKRRFRNARRLFKFEWTAPESTPETNDYILEILQVNSSKTPASILNWEKARRRKTKKNTRKIWLKAGHYFLRVKSVKGSIYSDSLKLRVRIPKNLSSKRR